MAVKFCIHYRSAAAAALMISVVKIEPWPPDCDEQKINSLLKPPNPEMGCLERCVFRFIGCLANKSSACSAMFTGEEGCCLGSQYHKLFKDLISRVKAGSFKLRFHHGNLYMTWSSAVHHNNVAFIISEQKLRVCVCVLEIDQRCVC